MTTETTTDNLGVELGRLCKAHGYTVAEVAATFKVTRATVYNWFSGKTTPHGYLRDQLTLAVERLREKPIETLTTNE